MTTTTAGKPGTWIKYTDLKVGDELNDGATVTAIKLTAKMIKITATVGGKEYTFSDRNYANVLVAR